MTTFDNSDDAGRIASDEFDRQAIYAQGYADGQRDLLSKLGNLRTEVRRFQKRQKDQELLLKEPERLVEAALKDTEVESALIMAVVSMLIASTDEEQA